MKKITALLAFAFALSHFNLKAQVTPPIQKIKKITVNGSAEMEIEPDEIYVNFQLKEFYNKQKVKIGIDEIKKDFLESCSKAGIAKEDIRVEGMGGSGYDYWFWRKKKREADFLADVTYIIKFSSTGKIDDLVKRLNDEATSNMYVSKTSNTKIEEFRKQVKIQATIAAKQKAQYLAESIGEKIGNALSIEEIGDTSPPVFYNKMMLSNMAMDANGGGGENTETPFQKIKLRYEVRAEFELQ